MNIDNNIKSAAEKAAREEVRRVASEKEAAQSRSELSSQFSNAFSSYCDKLSGTLSSHAKAAYATGVRFKFHDNSVLHAPIGTYWSSEKLRELIEKLVDGELEEQSSPQRCEVIIQPRIKAKLEKIFKQEDETTTETS
jgi:hypothetical protein